MQRKIIGYHLDEEQDWVAELDCYHGQHVRHKPPFFNRPWVITESGRNSQLASLLNCVRCDALEFPEGLSAYKKTPEFSQDSIPKGLLKQHSTKEGVWAIIHVLSGTLLYYPHDTNAQCIPLSKDDKGIIPPNKYHSVAAKSDVIFYVEFYRK